MLVMRKFVVVATALVMAFPLVGCNSPGDRALGGAALGGVGGAAVGSALSHGRAGGTLAGAAIGAASGAVIGAATAPQPPQCAQWGWDYYGNNVCVAYYNY
jgi:hypothetical protein